MRHREHVDLGGPLELGVDHHVLLPVQSGVVEGELHQVLDGMACARRHHVVVGLFLLEHEPHGLHVVAREPPVAPGVEVAEAQLLLKRLGLAGAEARPSRAAQGRRPGAHANGQVPWGQARIRAGQLHVGS